MATHCTRSPSGFSLIEVMMAMAILLVGFVGMIQSVTIGSDSLDTAHKQQVAGQLAMAEIEKLRAGAWTSVANLPATGTITIDASGAISGDATSFALTNHTADSSDDDATLGALARGLTCSFTRTYLRPSPATAGSVTFVRVVYTVSWRSNTGRQLNHQVETYFGKNGLHLSSQQS